MTQKQIISLCIVIVIVLITAFFWRSHAVAPTAPVSETSTSTAATSSSSPNTVSSGTVSQSATATSLPAGASVGTYTLKIGDTITAYGVTATLVSVAEDSRCPIGVQCIQAGTVRVNVKLEKVGLSMNQILELGKPVSAFGFTVELATVTPENKKGSSAISGADYRFVFTVAHS